MQRFGIFAVQCLLLASSALGLNVRLRGQKDASVAQLQQDDLFKMAWVPELKAGEKPPQARAADRECSDWKGGLLCHIENPEHALVRRWLPANATVMEFGARFGTTTCEIAKKLENSGRLVTVEPDDKVWTALEANVKTHQCHAHVLRGAVSSKPLFMLGSGYGGRSSLDTKNDMASHANKEPTFTFDEVEQASGLKFDTLLIDCEGCAQDMMDQIGPKIESQIKLVLLEADMPANIGGDCTHHCMDYEKFFSFLQKNNFEKVDEFSDCDRERTGSSSDDWCGPWIRHYAWRKKY